MKQPRRAHHLTLEVGADTYEDLIYALKQIIFDIERGSRQSVSGGYSTGWILSYSTDETMTHDRYFALLDTYIAGTQNTDPANGADQG